MKNSVTRRMTLFVLWLFILSHQIRPVVCYDHSYSINQQEKPSFYQFLSSTVSSLKHHSHQTYWEKIKTILHDFQLHFTPPNLDFRGTGKIPADTPGEKMKEAVKDSIGTSEVIAQKTAKSAAQAVHKTAEKVKGSVSNKQQESHDEL